VATLDETLERLVADPAFRSEVLDDPERALSGVGLTVAETTMLRHWLFGGNVPNEVPGEQTSAPVHG
jgi:hypothetical protein